MSANWIVRGGMIYAPFVSDGLRMGSPPLVGSVEPGRISFYSRTVGFSPNKVFKFINGHQRDLGHHRMITITAPFKISADGLRKVDGGKQRGYWVYQYKPDNLKITNSLTELKYARKVKTKLTKYVKQLNSDIRSLEKIRTGLVKLKDGL